MNILNSICFITNGFPSIIEPTKYTFLDQLVSAIADLGIECSVINPISIVKYRNKARPSVHWRKRSSRNKEIPVFCPRYISFASMRLWKINTALWTLNSFTAAVDRVIRQSCIKADAFYSHFIFPSGLAAAQLSSKYSIPAFCAVGESDPWSINALGAKQTRKGIRGKVHFFAVSSTARKMLVDHGLAENNEIHIFPNGVNLELFKPIDRSAMRYKFDFPQDSFIIIFVGTFSVGKGIFRLVETVNSIEGVSAIYVGNGDCETNPVTTLFKGPLPHDEIPQILNAADVFVLPTLFEGCSNAIIEALACGLPVISSKYDFNNEILDDECSIRIDPLNVDELRKAIVLLKDNPQLRQRMSEAALKKASQLDIHKRARNIVNWMESKLQSQ